MSPFKKVFTFIPMSILAVIMFYPFTLMIEQSFESKEQFRDAPGHSLASWEKLFTVMPIGRQLANSVIVCFGAITIILLLSSFAGFGLAKLTFRGTPFFPWNSWCVVGSATLYYHSSIRQH
jgi:ABC-type glycerol-3-phosphate transport system permease component